MTCKIKHQDKLIRDYIDGRLTPDEKDDFDAHCFDCDSCYQALVFHETISCLVREEGPVLFSDTHILQNKSQHRKKQTFISRLSNLFSIPAFQWSFTLAIVCTVFFFIGKSGAHRPKTLSELAERKAYPYIEMEMRDSGSPDNSFRYAMKAYSLKNYPEAIQHLSSVIAMDSSQTAARFYLAVSLFMENRNPEAEDLFIKLIREESNAERGYWYLSQIYLFQADASGASKMLQEVISLKQPGFSKRAEKLLTEISRFEKH